MKSMKKVVARKTGSAQMTSGATVYGFPTV